MWRLVNFPIGRWPCYTHQSMFIYTNKDDEMVSSQSSLLRGFRFKTSELGAWEKSKRKKLFTYDIINDCCTIDV